MAPAKRPSRTQITIRKRHKPPRRLLLTLAGGLQLLLLLLLLLAGWASAAAAAEPASSAGSGPRLKCTRQSIMLARQMLMHQLEESINGRRPSSWLHDSDRDEMLRGQKMSLASQLMLAPGASLMDPDARLPIEMEASYFRRPPAPGAQWEAPGEGAPTSVRLARGDKCWVSPDRRHFVYTFNLALGPVAHHLDVSYNYPRELRLSQPNEWSHAQLLVQVPRMHYQVTAKQGLEQRLNQATPALELTDLVYVASQAVGPTAGQPSSARAGGGLQPAPAPAAVGGLPKTVSVDLRGLVLDKSGHTGPMRLLLDRLFSDYTRPMVSSRLRQALTFALQSSSLPLAYASVPADQPATANQTASNPAPADY